MKLIIKNNKNKKSFIFTLLDFWSICIFVAAIIVFLIYITLTNNKSEEIINEQLLGANFPHYFMNTFQSEKIKLSDYEPKCTITDEMTRIELLQYFDSNPALMTADCLNALINSISIKQLDYHTWKVIDIFGHLPDNLGITHINCSASIPSYGIIPLKDYHTYDEKDWKSNVNSFTFDIPSQNGKIKVYLQYKHKVKK